MNIKVGMISLGCSKNLIDSENMLGMLRLHGYDITADINEAEAIIVNTCAFIDSAKQESINAILDAAKYKEIGKCRALICAGCLAERYQDEIMSEIPELDGVIGVNDIEKIVLLVKKTLSGEKAEYFPKEPKPIKGLPRIVTTQPHTAFLKIAEGCDNYCSYCAIPYIRGRYRSRKIESIVKEARKLIENGAKEIILIAQDTSRYGIDIYGEKSLDKLLHKLCTISKLEFIRVHYCYPEEITEELIQTFKNEKKILKYMDIPVQHCNDRILKRMNRKTTGAEIRALISHLRDEIPGIAIRTSLIVGFPGETQKEFEELCEFVREVKFDRLGVFSYCAEDGTPAAKMPDQIPEYVKEQRRSKIMEIQKEICDELGKKKIGNVMSVITEGFDPGSSLYYGRSYADSPDVDARVYFGAESIPAMGDIVRVRILGYDDYDLMGETAHE